MEMKRDRTTMDRYLMVLSQSRVFECKTCKRQFSSFQALGGHRASHKKPRLMSDDNENGSTQKPKTHECSICGLEFAIGQALGGHMRRHRAPPPPPNGNLHTTHHPLLFPDLNLTPLENDLKFFKIRLPTPLLHCFN